jgi:hypothetical protein
MALSRIMLLLDLLRADAIKAALCSAKLVHLRSS